MSGSGSSSGSVAGRKDDEGKLRWDLVPWRELEDVVGVLTYGEDKYGAHNWKTVASAQDRYFAAALRHLSDWRRGEKLDPESDLPHLAHAACSLLFLAWFDNRAEESKGSPHE